MQLNEAYLLLPFEFGIIVFTFLYIRIRCLFMLCSICNGKLLKSVCKVFEGSLKKTHFLPYGPELRNTCPILQILKGCQYRFHRSAVSGSLTKDPRRSLNVFKCYETNSHIFL